MVSGARKVWDVAPQTRVLVRLVSETRAGCIRTVTYKIGQTITVQGAVDSGSMQLGLACLKGTRAVIFWQAKDTQSFQRPRYIIKGGSAEVFVNHRYVKDVPRWTV